IAYAKPVAEGRPGARAGARAEALYVIGQARRHQGQLDEAVARLEAALAVGSDFDERAHLELARARRDGGDYETALQDFASLASSPTSEIAAEALFASAMIHRDRAADRRRHDDAEGRT